jgi:CRP-like cAMP-binding protein
MNLERLFQVLSQMYPVPEDLKRAIAKEIITMSLPKNHLLHEAPKIAEHAYFLEAGFAMSYSFVDGQRNVEGFWRSGQIILFPSSFFKQEPSLEYIQLMEKSDVLCISYPSVLKLFEQFPAAHFIYHKVMHLYYDQSRERIHDLRWLSAAKRFEKLVRSFPEIEQAVPQECIASYLGIAPQSLSRIKRMQDRS